MPFVAFTGLAFVQPREPWYPAPILAIAIPAILTLLPPPTVGVLAVTDLLAV